MQFLKDLWFIHGDNIIRRAKALLWHAGCVGAVAGLDWISKELGLLNLPEFAVVGIGLVIAQITKWLNDHAGMFGGMDNKWPLIVKRIKALAWQAGCISAIAGIDYLGKQLHIMNLPEIVVVSIGLVLAQITKWLNDNTRLFGGQNK